MRPEGYFVYLGAFLVFVAIMIVIGVWVSRRNRSGEDFLMAGRKLTTPLLTGTTLATLVGTGSSLGAVSLGYTDGWAAALYGIGGAAGVFLLLWLFADVRKHGFMTFPEEMSYYYGANRLVKGIVSVVLFVAEIGWLGAHILGGSLYLTYLTGMDPALAKVLVALGFGIYTVIGGYFAVVVTDAVQGIILFVGFTVLAVVALVAAGGFDTMTSSIPASSASFLGVGALGTIPAISLVIVMAVGPMATPSFRQRIYSANSTRTVRRSFALVGVLFGIFAVLPAIAGMAARSMTSGLDNPDLAFPYLATQVFPLWLGAFLLIAGLSATMSSASSDAVTGVTIWLRDVTYLVTGKLPTSEHMVRHSRIALVVVLALALGGALLADTIIGYITLMISTVLTGLLVAALLGKFWSRSTWQGGLAAIVGGVIAALVVNISDSLTEFWGNPVIPSLVVATVAGVVVSLITPRPRVTREEALDVLARERARMDAGTQLRGGESDQHGEGSTDGSAEPVRQP